MHLHNKFKVTEARININSNSYFIINIIAVCAESLVSTNFYKSFSVSYNKYIRSS